MSVNEYSKLKKKILEDSHSGGRAEAPKFLGGFAKMSKIEF
jgi:hypothetical protein